jgi:hypothetical protein
VRRRSTRAVRVLRRARRRAPAHRQDRRRDRHCGNRAREELRRDASANGVDDLRSLSAEELHDLEPDVRAVAGFLSPSTGIVDSHASPGLTSCLAIARCVRELAEVP